MSKRQRLTTAKRWVVKIGSALLTGDGVGLNHADIARWVQQMAHLHEEEGMELLLVSSGAVAEGMCRLGWQPTCRLVWFLARSSGGSRSIATV